MNEPEAGNDRAEKWTVNIWNGIFFIEFRTYVGSISAVIGLLVSLGLTVYSNNLLVFTAGVY